MITKIKYQPLTFFHKDQSSSNGRS
jgi:hypothetical protein